jgi:hypothetical protein
MIVGIAVDTGGENCEDGNRMSGSPPSRKRIQIWITVNRGAIDGRPRNSSVEFQVAASIFAGCTFLDPSQ